MDTYRLSSCITIPENEMIYNLIPTHCRQHLYCNIGRCILVLLTVGGVSGDTDYASVVKKNIHAPEQSSEGQSHKFY